MLLDYQVSQTSRKFESFQDFLQLTLCPVSPLLCGFSPSCGELKGYSLVGVCRLLTAVDFSLWSTGSGACGPSSCGSWVPRARDQ